MASRLVCVILLATAACAPKVRLGPQAMDGDLRTAGYVEFCATSDARFSRQEYVIEELFDGQAAPLSLFEKLQGRKDTTLGSGTVRIAARPATHTYRVYVRGSSMDPYRSGGFTGHAPEIAVRVVTNRTVAVSIFPVLNEGGRSSIKRSDRHGELHFDLSLRAYPPLGPQQASPCSLAARVR